MDLIEVMQDKGEKILAKALVSTTHWNVKNHTYHRMGAAIVDGYLNLHMLRQTKSYDYVYRYWDSMGAILQNSPELANAYSLGSGEYLRVDDLGMNYKKVVNNEEIEITSAEDLSQVIFFEHIQRKLSLQLSVEF